MHLGSLRRRAMAIAGGVAMVLAAAGPNVAAAAGPPPPPPLHIDVNISDSGFDKTVYNVQSTFITVTGDVTFHNVGSMVHSATVAPGSQSNFGTNIETKTDANGNLNYACYRTGALIAIPHVTTFPNSAGCTKQSVLDTGGIAPGASVTIGLDRTDAPGASAHFLLTSAPDCLNGNHSTTFNCNPVTLNVTSGAGSFFGPSAKLGPSSGSLLGSTTDPNCPQQGKRVPQSGLPYCFLTTPYQYSTTKGSAVAPLSGNITVTIDDVQGFQPDNVYITAGSQVTWINKGTRIHGVSYSSPISLKGVNVVQANLGGVQPGQSVSQGFPCNYLQNPASPCTWTYSYGSFIQDDLYPCSMEPVGPLFGCFQPINTAMNGNINIVPAPSS